jgi:hypothetical protein
VVLWRKFAYKIVKEGVVSFLDFFFLSNSFTSTTGSERRLTYFISSEFLNLMHAPPFSLGLRLLVIIS